MKIKNIVDLETIAVGKITGLPGEDSFHCANIDYPYVCVMVTSVAKAYLALPFPNPDEGQNFLGDVKGANILWSSKFMRKG